jgi:hypothetical protein
MNGAVTSAAIANVALTLVVVAIASVSVAVVQVLAGQVVVLVPVALLVGRVASVVQADQASAHQAVVVLDQVARALLDDRDLADPVLVGQDLAPQALVVVGLDLLV